MRAFKLDTLVGHRFTIEPWRMLRALYEMSGFLAAANQQRPLLIVLRRHAKHIDFNSVFPQSR